MNIQLELAEKLVADMVNGFFVPRKKDGVWTREQIDFQTLLKGYCTLEVPRNCFLSVYKKIPPLEALPKEEKSEWKKFINEIFEGKPPKFRLEAVKIIYTISTLKEKFQNEN